MMQEPVIQPFKHSNSTVLWKRLNTIILIRCVWFIYPFYSFQSETGVPQQRD